MRTIKASEVVKGMRVRVIDERRTGVTVTTEGLVTDTYGTSTHPRSIWFEEYGLLHIPPDHPVTVLGEAEPEWVEGAWYWASVNGSDERPVRRVGIGWTPYRDGLAYWTDLDATVDVSGRFLAVYWPGDDVARELETNGGHHNGIGLGPIKKVCRAVADAIRTQGGVR